MSNVGKYPLQITMQAVKKGSTGRTTTTDPTIKYAKTYVVRDLRWCSIQLNLSTEKKTEKELQPYKMQQKAD